MTKEFELVHPLRSTVNEQARLKIVVFKDDRNPKKQLTKGYYLVGKTYDSPLFIAIVLSMFAVATQAQMRITEGLSSLICVSFFGLLSTLTSRCWSCPLRHSTHCWRVWPQSAHAFRSLNPQRASQLQQKSLRLIRGFWYTQFSFFWSVCFLAACTSSCRDLPRSSSLARFPSTCRGGWRRDMLDGLRVFRSWDIRWDSNTETRKAKWAS
jgi:hypothetical protein